MSNIFDILKSETEEPNENYGSWCFFGFDITDIKNYSFPFFVRSSTRVSKSPFIPDEKRCIKDS